MRVELLTGGEAMNLIKLFMTVISVLLAILVLQVAPSQALSVVDTKHNLSAGATASNIRALDEQRVCIFCHSPHHASSVTPLWSRPTGGSVYDIYASSSLAARPGQPTGTSRLCLSCHDGTIAVGMLFGATQPIPMIGGITTIPVGTSNLGTDLRDDHPISFTYDHSLLLEKQGELTDPSLLISKGIKLEEERMECSSCHDPHKNPFGKFLVKSNQIPYNEETYLCAACHNKAGWAASSARNLSLSIVVNGTPKTLYACEVCHMTHKADQPVRLIRGVTEQDTCIKNCHNGSLPLESFGTNVGAQFSKAFRHPLDYANGVHALTENPLTAGKHVECVDCHNPHQANSQGAPLSSPPAINGRLTGVKGVDISGSVVAMANYEYEICLKCHAENSFVSSAAIPRQNGDTNERLRFDPVNLSFHPVAAVGKNTASVPSLRLEISGVTPVRALSTSSRVYCSDCHDPHGADTPHLLVARYEQPNAYLPYLQSNYALCYRCHDQNILLAPTLSAFPPHQSHVETHKVPCSVCHDPHGVAVNAHLINFDTRSSFVNPIPAPVYDSATRSCTVSCHSVNPKIY